MQYQLSDTVTLHTVRDRPAKEYMVAREDGREVRYWHETEGWVIYPAGTRFRTERRAEKVIERMAAEQA